MPGIERTLSRGRERAGGLAVRLTDARPLPILAVACAAQLGIALWIALSATHNHFVWYSGGDATEYWTASWSLAHGEIGQTIVGFGVPVLYAWVPLVTGTTLIAGLPVIAVAQAAVLVPLAVVLLWAVADRLFGRLFAWWATFLWIVGPLLMLAGFSGSYAPQFKSLFLAPHWYGLTNMADMPSLVAVLACAWASLRLAERRTVPDGLLAGVLTGVLIALKPANGYFLPALAVLLVATWRARPVLAWAAGFVPALVTLALWKERGLGHLPITSATAQTRVAGGIHPVVALATGKYLQFDWSHLSRELNDLGGVFWSVRLLEFAAVAGALAALRRDRVKGLFLILWFAAYCVVKGSSGLAAVVTLSYWRFVEPGIPAFVLLAASLVYLVPRRARAFAVPRRAASLAGGRWTLGAAAAILAVLPLVVVAAASPASTPHYARSDALANDAPLSDELAVSARMAGGDVDLAWRPVHTGATGSYYVVYRSSLNDGCTVPPQGARECQLVMDPVGMTRATTFTDRPGSGSHWYRIALMANYQNAVTGSDLMLLGPATEARSSR